MFMIVIFSEIDFEMNWSTLWNSFTYSDTIDSIDRVLKQLDWKRHLSIADRRLFSNYKK